MSYLIRTDGAAHLGIGHVKRCLALAEALQSNTLFALRYTSPAIEALIRRAGHDYLTVRDDSSEEAIRLRAQGGRNGIILDISHAETIRRLKDMPAYVAELQSLFPMVWLIDGMGPDALCEHAPVKADVTIVPYVGARAGKHGLWLTGSRYCILGTDCPAVRHRVISEHAKRILITAGGSDPGSISMIALEALTQITDRTLDIRLVEGAEFLQSLRKNIHNYVEASGLSVVLLMAPNSLFEHMLWCDLCISASGLTKYELAATGTPAVHISQDQGRAAAGRAFSAMNTAIDLGHLDGISVKRLADTVKSILDDRDRRADMSARGRALIDGQGASRVATAIRFAYLASARGTAGHRLPKTGKSIEVGR